MHIDDWKYIECSPPITAYIKLCLRV